MGKAGNQKYFEVKKGKYLGYRGRIIVEDWRENKYKVHMYKDGHEVQRHWIDRDFVRIIGG